MSDYYGSFLGFLKLMLTKLIEEFKNLK